MAKLGEEFTFNSISIKPFFRLPVCPIKENGVLINDGRNSVVKVHDRKLLQSWTLTHPHYLTTPVIYDNEAEAMYCVMNNKVLLKWSLSEEVLNNAMKSEFKDSIFAVLPVPKHFSVILFTTGKVLHNEILAPYSKPMGRAFIKNGEEIVWADTVSVSQQPGINIICLGFSRKNKTFSLHWFTLLEKGVSNYNVHNLENEVGILKNWCLNKHTNSLLTIWSDGSIFNHSLTNDAKSLLMKTPDITEQSILAISCIDANHIGLIKSNPKSKESDLEIWDFKFVALKVRKVLKIASPNSFQLHFIGSSVYLSCNGELTEISFHVEKSTLSAAIGKSTTASTKVQEFSWNKGQLTQVSKIEQSPDKMDTSEHGDGTLNATELIAQRLLEDDSDCLSNIPESELVRLLRLAIRYKSKEKSKVPNIQPDVILNAIFSASFSDVVLLKFMKRLSLEDSMVTLEVLLSFLTDKMNLKSTRQRPSDLQIFNWVCLIIQSHMEGLLLSKDKRRSKLLQKLDSCLSEKMTEYEDYESIQHLFLVIQKKNNILPEKYVVGKYCIDTLDT